MDTGMYVVLPELSANDPLPVGQRPVLYLLHGMTEDCSAWVRRTAIERYVSAYGLVAVMPSAGRSFYANMRDGPRYFTHIADEVPAMPRHFFNISQDKAIVAGLSMGGYGAFKLALTYPERYIAACSLSGSLVFDQKLLEGEDMLRRDLEYIFGDLDAIAGGDDDLTELLRRRTGEGTRLPRLYQYCGTEDFLYESNLRFRDLARSLGVGLTFTEDGGDHAWPHWDRHVRRFLATLAAERNK